MVVLSKAPMFLDEFTAGPVWLYQAMKSLAKPIRVPAKAIAYQVRYWSHVDKQWMMGYLTFTNKQKAFTFQKTFAANEKATVIATLSNGKKVFISGTKR